MLLINPQITSNVLSNEGYNDLLYKIDCTIAWMAKKQLLSDIYGIKTKVDYEAYEELCDYREILLDKLMGCNCLQDANLMLIVSKIQKITY